MKPKVEIGLEQVQPGHGADLPDGAADRRVRRPEIVRAPRQHRALKEPVGNARRPVDVGWSAGCAVPQLGDVPVEARQLDLVVGRGARLAPDHADQGNGQAGRRGRRQDRPEQARR
jgi:hypothetical protein